MSEAKPTASTSTASHAAPATPSNPFAAFAPFDAAFDPMAMWSTTQQAFHKFVADAVTRGETFAAQYAVLETQLIGRAQDAVAGWAQLAHEAITYGAQLSAEARKLGLDAARARS